MGWSRWNFFQSVFEDKRWWEWWSHKRGLLKHVKRGSAVFCIIYIYIEGYSINTAGLYIYIYIIYIYISSKNIYQWAMASIAMLNNHRVIVIYQYYWLVVSSMVFIFHFIYGIIPTPLTNSYFSRWLKPPTSIYIYIYIMYIGNWYTKATPRIWPTDNLIWFSLNVAFDLRFFWRCCVDLDKNCTQQESQAIHGVESGWTNKNKGKSYIVLWNSENQQLQLVTLW